MSEIIRSDLPLRQLMATGLVDGGLLSINADPTKFDLSAGMGYIVDNYTNSLSPVVTRVTWNAFTAQTATFRTTNAISNILINSAGAIVQQTGAFSQDQLRDHICIGRLVHNNLSTITDTISLPRVFYGAVLDGDDLALALGTFNVSGNWFVANGANLNVNKLSGQTYYTGSNYKNSRKSPNIFTDPAQIPCSFGYRYRNGVGGFTQQATTAAINPNNWDNGTGTLATVANNKFTVQRLYFFSASNPANPNVIIQYGQTEYASMALAEAGITSDSFTVDPNLGDALLRCALITEKGTTDLTNTAKAKFISAGKFGDLAVGGGGGGGGGGSGDVVGPASSVDSDIAVFNGATGKIIRDSGIKMDEVPSGWYRAYGT